MIADTQAARPSEAYETNAALARLAFPGFWFSQISHRCCPVRWVAVSQDDATAGLYAVVTADLNVLTAALVLDQAWRGGHPGPVPRL